MNQKLVKVNDYCWQWNFIHNFQITHEEDGWMARRQNGLDYGPFRTKDEGIACAVDDEVLHVKGLVLTLSEVIDVSVRLFSTVEPDDYKRSATAQEILNLWRNRNTVPHAQPIELAHMGDDERLEFLEYAEDQERIFLKNAREFIEKASNFLDDLEMELLPTAVPLHADVTRLTRLRGVICAHAAQRDSGSKKAEYFLAAMDDFDEQFWLDSLREKGSSIIRRAYKIGA